MTRGNYYGSLKILIKFNKNVKFLKLFKKILSTIYSFFKLYTKRDLKNSNLPLFNHCITFTSSVTFFRALHWKWKKRVYCHITSNSMSFEYDHKSHTLLVRFSSRHAEWVSEWVNECTHKIDLLINSTRAVWLMVTSTRQVMIKFYQ